MRDCVGAMRCPVRATSCPVDGTTYHVDGMSSPASATRYLVRAMTCPVDAMDRHVTSALGAALAIARDRWGERLVTVLPLVTSRPALIEKSTLKAIFFKTASSFPFSLLAHLLTARGATRRASRVTQ
jgi:hypothetical protein